MNNPATEQTQGAPLPQSTKKIAEDMRKYSGAAVFTTHSESNAQTINKLCGADSKQAVTRVQLIVLVIAAAAVYFVGSYAGLINL